MLELNGFKYSQEQFEGYKFRSIIRLDQGEDWRKDIVVNIFTDNPNKEEVFEIINSRTKENITYCKMEHWTTKEQDDLSAKFIEETLKDI